MRKTLKTLKLKKQKPLHGGSPEKEDLQVDVDYLSLLIFKKTPYSDFCKGGLVIEAKFNKFFQIQGKAFESTAANDYLNKIINMYNSKGQTLLYVACAFGTLDMIEVLLTCPNIEVNLPNNTLIANDGTENGFIHVDGSTPFIGCCYKRNNLSEIKQIFKMFLFHEMKRPHFDFYKFKNSILDKKNARKETANNFLKQNADELINNFLLNLN